MQHAILSFFPFIVRYMYNGLSTDVRYEVPLTKQEILAEYDSIIFETEPKLINFQIWHNNTNTRFSMEIHAKRDFVGTIAAHNLSEAFKLAQNDFSENYRRFGVRSTSVGDVFVDMSTGKGYIINGLGFEMIGKVHDLQQN
jgi:hypothetical protein